MQKKVNFCFMVGFLWGIAATAISNEPNYTVINTKQYVETVKQSEQDIIHVLDQFKRYQLKPAALEARLSLAIQYFKDRPYCTGKDYTVGVEGEGDWCANDMTRHGCPHLQQDPIYRTDAFVCNTLVQTVLALIQSNTLAEFNRNIIAVRYGAAHEPSNPIHYYNRNHFISADFNPINQKNGFLRDVTEQGDLAHYVKQTSAVIDRQSWFDHNLQPKNLKATLRVLSSQNGEAMVDRARDHYPAKFHHFLPEKITIDYLPKGILVKKISANGVTHYQVNTALLNQLPTPSVIEIVRDAKLWKVGNQFIADVIGTELNVSHLGLLYRKHFKFNEVIYHKISCVKKDGKKICQVTPVVCRQVKGCTPLLFVHAGDPYPDGYFYYRDQRGSYHCDANIPVGLQNGLSAIPCNRVMSMPLADYLLSYQYGKYTLLDEPSILGIHVEKIQ